MRIIDMRPEITPWDDKKNTDRIVGNWSFRDHYMPIGGYVRDIYHYSTLMIEFVGFERYFDADRGEMVMEWQATPVSIGHGSVSDQGGMNQLLSVNYWNRQITYDYGYRYHRDQRGGGPRIMNIHTNEEVS